MGDDKKLVNPLENLDLDENKATPEPEKVEDNSDDDKGKEDKKPEKVEPEKKVEPKKEPTPKELRHAQQLDGAKREVDRLKQLVIDREVKDASDDITSLLELHKKDPKLAKEVADKFDWTDTEWANYSGFLSAKGVVAEKPVFISDEEIDKRVQAKLAEIKHTEALNDAKALLEKLPEEQRQEALDEFEDLIEGKTLTREKALKYAELVTLSMKKVKKIDPTDGLKKLNSAGMGGDKKPSGEDLVEVVDPDGKIILLPANKIK